MSQLSLLVPQKTSRGAGSAKTTPEEIGLQNHHLIRFVKIYPYGPSQPRYKLQIEAQLPGFFHLEEAEQILKSTNSWRWGELHSLGQLGILIERAIAGTEKGRSSND